MKHEKTTKMVESTNRPTLDNRQYGLFWDGKESAKQKASSLQQNLELVLSKTETHNSNDVENIVIAGDNLETLKLLKQDYANKIDVIYIDPPYNTGNKFIFKDRFNQATYKTDDCVDNDNFVVNQTMSSKLHTNWLNMIYPRLILARELLNKNGLIFISIDDNEYARLKLLCEEIFGEENFVATMIWRKKRNGGGSARIKIEIETEYVLVFQKQLNFKVFSGKVIDATHYRFEDEYIESRGKYNLTDLDRVCSSSVFKYVESLDYEIKAPDGTMFKNHRNELKPGSYRYTVSKPLFDFMLENGFIKFKKINGFWRVYRKSYEKVTIDNKKLAIVPRKFGGSYNNIIDESSITTASGKKELISLINNKDFSFPKPVKLVEYLISFHNNKNALVLDFFAGSGTTAEAVMSLNNFDNGHRKYILIQQHEKIQNKDYKDILDITKSRINNSIVKHNYKNGYFKFYELKQIK
mgnify:CR=1 FL=1